MEYLNVSLRKIKDNFIKHNVSQITIYKNDLKELELINENHPKLIETMSVTKSFLAIAILFLIRDKKISSVNDKVSDYLKEWNNDQRKNITIKDILSMTAQLENNWDYDTFMFPNKKLGEIKKPNVDRIARNIKYSCHKLKDDFEYNNTATQIIPLFSKSYSKYKYKSIFK